MLTDNDRRGCAGELECGKGRRFRASDGVHADTKSIARFSVEFGEFEGIVEDWGDGVEMFEEPDSLCI